MKYFIAFEKKVPFYLPQPRHPYQETHQEGETMGIALLKALYEINIGREDKFEIKDLYKINEI